MTGGKTYDLVVIGTGTAAQITSFRVRAAGWPVAVPIALAAFGVWLNPGPV